MNINALISKLFGNKSDHDMREIQPFVEEVKKVYEEIDQSDNDVLRHRTKELQEKVQHSADDLREEINKIKAVIEDTPIENRAELFSQVDKLEKDVLERMEEKLNEVMPEAFAIMKSTARRFAENETVEVTATDFDRELATTHDFVEIEGDKAVYHNH